MVKDSINSSTDKEDMSPRKYTKRDISLSRFKRRLLKHVYVVRGLIVLLFVGLFVAGYLIFVQVAKESGLAQRFALARDFVFPQVEVLDKSAGRTNIVLLGKGGSGHDAPDLTDTLIFFSVDLEGKDVTQVAIPRDIWIPALRTKLNSAYYWGNQKEEGGGLVLAKSAVEEIVGMPVHYGLVFDFEAFRQVIEILGGVEVEVENAFVDPRFPVPGRENDLCDGDPELSCRYETLEFAQGKQFMDAEVALKFVRSRNAEGDEGTDFARGRRQQVVISAVISKLLSKEILLSPHKAFAAVNTVFANIETDMTMDELATIARLIFDARNTVNNVSLPEDLLVNPPPYLYDNLYVLIPAAGDWADVHSWVQSVLQ